MARYGAHLGTAFQLIDDVLDYSGDHTIIGKNVGDDLAEGKATLPLIYVMRQGTAASLPAVWERYATIDAARAAVRGMYSDDRVLRVLIVTDDVPPRFAEWVER